MTITWTYRGAVATPSCQTESVPVRGLVSCAAAWLAQDVAGWTGARTVADIWYSSTAAERARAVAAVRAARIV